VGEGIGVGGGDISTAKNKGGGWEWAIVWEMGGGEQ